MKFYRALMMLILVLVSTDYAISASVNLGTTTTISGISTVSFGIPIVTHDYNVLTDGNLFLDYSLFSENNLDLFIGANVSLIASAITIFSNTDIPTMPDLLTLTLFNNPDLIMNLTGDSLLFSDGLILSGNFEATGNIYVGNYSSLRPVPLPTTLLLFISGLITLLLKQIKKIVFQSRTKKNTLHYVSTLFQQQMV